MIVIVDVENERPLTGMAKHSCCECKWCHCLFDSSNRYVEICVFDQSDNYLQEVLLSSDDCELDEYAEELWQAENGG